MLIPIMSYVVLFMLPFFMYSTGKKLTEIRDILKELNERQKSTTEKDSE
ncbi:hypothetical protein [Candidatus Stoquefichus sp. SB1]|jgi:Na+/melibiose symporter-like transporter|nr:hypothetical protein [Candidatus Stoquefichus sp. SB1]